jgi:polyisoprenoid-binding protein YceI
MRKGAIRKQSRGSLIAGAIATCFLLAPWQADGQNRPLLLRFSPSDTSVRFTLGDIFHTVHGSFNLKSGDVEYSSDPISMRGTVVIDATSGASGNKSRDRKMHREVLESARFPEISFRPDRSNGTVAPLGHSTIQVHGVFSIHGADHELTIPVRVQMFPDHWVADAQFNVPYVKWGMRNPSTLLLRVSESVEIEVHATGANPFGDSGPR